MPNLSGYNAAKVARDNQLYALALQIILFALRRNIIVSAEGPVSSWVWAALIAMLLRDYTEEDAKLYNTLVMVDFHDCCHGSRRKKHTGWLSTRRVYQQLHAECRGDHTHLPFGVSWLRGRWRFDTADERVYPKLLAQRVAKCLVEVALQANWSLNVPPRLHDLSTAAHGTQSKRRRPIVPEYHHFQFLPATQPLPDNCKQLPPHLGGECSEDAAPMDVHNPDDFAMEHADNDEVATPSLGDRIKVGFYHTPKQFLSLALQAQRPMDVTNHIEEPTRFALSFNMKYSAEVVKLERKKNILHARLMAKRLEGEEKALHAALDPHLQQVLKGKNLLLWKELLVRYNYDDLAVRSAVGWKPRRSQLLSDPVPNGHHGCGRSGQVFGMETKSNPWQAPK